MNTKIQAANAKPATSAHTFAAGDRVIVCNSKTNDTKVAGVITAIAKGWYNLETEEFGNVSARISSLSPCAKQAAAPIVALPNDSDLMGDSDLMDDLDPDDLDDPETAASKMAAALKAARVRYTKTHRPDGTPSADCADLIAKELRDLEPLEVAALADRCLQVAKGTHEAKYGHLNPGQIRMNSGNRIRAAWKTAHEDGDEATIKHLMFVLGLDGDDDE